MDRRNWVLLIAFIAGALCACAPQTNDASYAAKMIWGQVNSPDFERVWNKAQRRDFDIAGFENTDLDAVVVYQGGAIVFERFQQSGDGHTPRNVRSVTKAVVASAIAVADGKGDVDIHAEVSQINQHDIPAYLSPMTLNGLLDMSAGLSWSDSELQPYVAKDMVAAILADPKIQGTERPGFRYSGTQTQLAAAILTETTGENLAEAVNTRVLSPINVSADWWQRRRFGPYIAGTGLVLSPYDMLAFGVLYLDQGRFEGQQILPKNHIKEVFSGGVRSDRKGSWYSKGWWRSYHNKTKILSAAGFSGHHIAVIPSRNAVIVLSGRTTFQTLEEAQARGAKSSQIMRQLVDQL